MSHNVHALLLATIMLAISPAVAKGIKYPAKMQGAWCFKEKVAGADEYNRCGNGEKPSFQIVGNELRMAADLGCQLVAPLKLKRISRIGSRAVATEKCDGRTIKTDYTYSEGGHLSVRNLTGDEK
jgi:hypothetical protein